MVKQSVRQGSPKGKQEVWMRQPTGISFGIVMLVGALLPFFGFEKII